MVFCHYINNIGNYYHLFFQTSASDVVHQIRYDENLEDNTSPEFKITGSKTGTIDPTTGTVTAK